MSSALNTLGDNADEVASYLGGMDWTDAGNWDELQEFMEQSEIEITDSMRQFIEEAKNAANTLKTIDLKKLSSDLAAMYDTLKGLKSGS
jgi:hypothetical protein